MAGRSVWLGSVRTLRLRVGGVVAVVSVASLLAVPERSGAVPEPGVPAPVDESVAVQRARVSKQRVEVETLRDEYSLTFARPDGSFVMEASLRPQRVRRSDGSWAAVDTTLRRNGDGTVS